MTGRISWCLLIAWTGLTACADGHLFPFSSRDAAGTDAPPLPADADVSPGDTTTWNTQNAATDAGTAGVPQTDTGETASTESRADTDTVPSVSLFFDAEQYTSVNNRGGQRSWVLSTYDAPADVQPDGDNNRYRAKTAFGQAFIEALPDVKASDTDTGDGYQLINDPNDSPTVSYAVDFPTPGRYYVWARVWCSAQGNDNSLFVGIDNTWPESGNFLQFPQGTGGWIWRSNKRNSGGDVMGVPNTIYLDVPTAGRHLVQFAMREDGLDFDAFALTTDTDFVPPEP